MVSFIAYKYSIHSIIVLVIHFVNISENKQLNERGLDVSHFKRFSNPEDDRIRSFKIFCNL